MSKPYEVLVQEATERFVDDVAKVVLDIEHRPQPEGISVEEYRSQSLSDVAVGILNIISCPPDEDETVPRYSLTSTTRQPGPAAQWEDAHIQSFVAQEYGERYAKLKDSYLK